MPSEAETLILAPTPSPSPQGGGAKRGMQGGPPPPTSAPQAAGGLVLGEGQAASITSDALFKTLKRN